MSRLLRVDELVSQVRSQIDEENQDTIDTTEDILPALNRGQNFAIDILSRHYEDPLLRNATLPLVAGQSEYDMPEDMYSDRLEKVEIYEGGDYVECTRISYRDATRYESTASSSSPRYYCVVGRKIRFITTPTGVNPARIWYIQAPEQLVLPQGRITTINTGSNYVVVDSVGDDLSTEVDALESYVNLVDGQTGRIKCSMQIRNIVGNRITFKSTPARTTVAGRTIETDLVDIPDIYLTSPETGTVTIEEDDYICSISGSSIMYFRDPVSNFIIQFATSAMKRKVGDAAEMEESILAKFEKQVEHTWAGREQQLRIKKRSHIWNRSRRRRT